ncbi:MAG: type II secretion system protein, partial [Bacilli bacterium]
MKNKGFTLVELLGTILILALVMIIGVPKIIEIVYKSKMEIMVKNEQKLLMATENYLVKNRHKFPTGIGDAIEVTLSELQTDGFIDIIKSPYGN